MNITKHAKKRYTERIKEIHKDEVAYYMNNNEEQIVEDVLKIFEHSTKVWRGQLGDNVTRNYYMSSNIILVTNTDDSAIVTLYKVDFGFPTETNLKVSKDLVDKIKELEEQGLEVIEKSEQEDERLEYEIGNFKMQLSILEEQMKNCKDNIKLREEELKLNKTKVHHIENEVKKYAVMLCNSKELKNDLATI